MDNWLCSSMETARFRRIVRINSVVDWAVRALTFRCIRLRLIPISLMNESTENYTSEQIQEELRKIGSSISVYADDSRTVMNVNTLKKNLPRTLELVEEVLYRPKFTEEDFDRLKKQQLEGLMSEQKNPAGIANNVYRRLLYGDDHIYSVAWVEVADSKRAEKLVALRTKGAPAETQKTIYEMLLIRLPKWQQFVE